MAANSDIYQFVVVIKINPGKIDQALQAFEEISALTKRNSEGVIVYQFWSVDGRDEILAYETWESRAAHGAHLQSSYLREWQTSMADRRIFEGTFTPFEPTKEDFGVDPSVVVGE